MSISANPNSGFIFHLQTPPLAILGVPNAYIALMAESVGFQALYLSGSGVATFNHGVPDLGLTTLEDVAEEALRITKSTKLPLLVDIDTGWGERIGETIVTMESLGVKAVHIEDQVEKKRCGHRPGKTLVDTRTMCKRLEKAAEAKKDPQFTIMARLDGFENEGLRMTIKRAKAYREAGANALFAEALTSLDDYRKLKEAVDLPLLANCTEFGKTPLFTLEEFGQSGVDMVLFPLSVARVMNQAAFDAMVEIKEKGTQKSLIPKMQTRDALYRFLNYESYENSQH